MTDRSKTELPWICPFGSFLCFALICCLMWGFGLVSSWPMRSGFRRWLVASLSQYRPEIQEGLLNNTVSVERLTKQWCQWCNSLSLNANMSLCEKTVQPARGSTPWHLAYRASGLPTELTGLLFALSSQVWLSPVVWHTTRTNLENCSWIPEVCKHYCKRHTIEQANAATVPYYAPNVT